jgi:hypothetical protein
MNLLCLNPFGIAAISTTALVSRDGGLVYFTLLNDGDPGHNVLRLWCQLRRSAVVAIFPTQKRGHRTCDSGPRAGHVVLCQPASGSLILTQGALYAVGRILLYSSVCLLVDEWFVRSKGIAFGVMWAGTGFSGISVPYIFSLGLVTLFPSHDASSLGGKRFPSSAHLFSTMSSLAFRSLKPHQ